jgi:hypothetical protein
MKSGAEVGERQTTSRPLAPLSYFFLFPIFALLQSASLTVGAPLRALQVEPRVEGGERGRGGALRGGVVACAFLRKRLGGS